MIILKTFNIKNGGYGLGVMVNANYNKTFFFWRMGLRKKSLDHSTDINVPVSETFFKTIWKMIAEAHSGKCFLVFDVGFQIFYELVTGPAFFGNT